METLWNGLTFCCPASCQSITTDSVLLAAFAAETLDEKRIRACDLCCGSGLITLLMAARCPRVSFCGLDVDPQACEGYRQNAVDNGLTHRMEAICTDLADVRNRLQPGSFQAIVTNPPYFEPTRGAASPNPARQLARQGCSLKTVLAASAYLLNGRGTLFLSFPTSRLAELFCAMSAVGIEPKRLRLVAHTAEAAPSVALVSGTPGAAAGLHCEPLLILYDRQGQMTPACAAAYGQTGHET